LAEGSRLVTKQDSGRKLASAMSIVGIGWYLAVSIIGGIIGGVLLDGWLETKPLFTLLGLFLGLAVAFYGAYRALMQVVGTSTTKGPDED
jgi:ATP synthase protein I